MVEESKSMEGEIIAENEEDEFDVVPEKTTGAEEVQATTPEQINQTEEVTYENELADNPDIKNYLEYQRLKKKILNGIDLTPEEQLFKDDIEEEQRINEEAESAQNKLMEEERLRQEKKQSEIMAEYNEVKATRPDKILKVNEKDITLHGGESFVKILTLLMAIKKAKKKGSKLLIQVFRGKKVVFSFTNKELSFVEFYSTDEKGNVLQEITRITEYEYRLEGTAVPVLFAIQGFAEGFDFFKDFRKDLSSEMVSRLITRAFYAGYLKGAEVKQPDEKKDMFGDINKYLPLIILIIMGIVAYLCYMIYQDNTKILEALELIQASRGGVTILP